MTFSLSIQYLRATAAIMVVLYHVILHWRPESVHNYSVLGTGVDIFFVISGFIMWMSTGPEMTPPQFTWKRIRRIVPLYWIMTSVMALILFMAPSVFLSSTPNAYHIISSYLFIPSIHPVKKMWEPLVFTGWTLNYEMFFYAIFALTMFAPFRFRAWLLAATLACCMAAGLIPHPPTSLLTFYGSSIWLEFLGGVVLALVFQRGESLPLAAALLMFVVGAVAMELSQTLIPTHIPRGMLFGPPAFLIVAGALYAERAGAVRAFWSFKILGDASYSIYLSHVLAVSALFQLLRHFPHQAAPAITMQIVVATAGALAFGVGTYFLVERPVSRWLGRRRMTSLRAA